MRTRLLHKRSSAATLAGALLALLCAPPGARASSPAASEYSVRGVCAPPVPGRASCLALRLVPKTAVASSFRHPLGLAPGAQPAARLLRSGARASEPCEKEPRASERCFGLTPRDLHSAYSLPTEAPGTQTIALVDAYNDLTAEADLQRYDEEFGLPACTKANGCLSVLNEHGEADNPPFPKTEQELLEARSGSPARQEEAEEAEGWTVEISLDIETARAVCNNCHIVLVEAETPDELDLESAEVAAEEAGAQEISNSWGGPECVGGECLPEEGILGVFHDPGTVITASAGDDGYLDWDGSQKGLAEFPSASPLVVAVGGTRLLTSESGARVSETVWNDGGPGGAGAGGGGCSTRYNAQSWQRSLPDWASVSCSGKRSVADVAADADPYTGLAVYDSSSAECESAYKEGSKEVVVHWCPIGGTSLASPLVAGVYALAGGSHGVEYPARTLYENESSLFDVTKGSNGECKKPFGKSPPYETGCTIGEEAKTSCAEQLRCLAASGYDGPTGLGTPDGIAAFEPKEGSRGEGPPTPSEPSAPPASAPTTPAPTPAPAPTPTVASTPPQMRLSTLALTLKALVALNTSHPQIAQIGFTFVSNLTTGVSVSLQKRVRHHGHTRWQSVTRVLEINADSGRNNGRLRGHGRLKSGTYRLTLTPQSGPGEALIFKIG